MDMVQHLHVARIVEVVDFQQFFHLQHPFLGEGSRLRLFIDGEIAGVPLSLPGKGVGLLLDHLSFYERWE